MYDSSNIFAKIIQKKLPADIVFEDNEVLAFKDIAPEAPNHILVIPKGNYIDFKDFCNKASPEIVSSFFGKVSKIADDLNCDFRILSNCGSGAGQSVFHFHVHILAGKQMTKLLPYD